MSIAGIALRESSGFFNTSNDKNKDKSKIQLQQMFKDNKEKETLLDKVLSKRKETKNQTK